MSAKTKVARSTGIFVDISQVPGDLRSKTVAWLMRVIPTRASMRSNVDQHSDTQLLFNFHRNISAEDQEKELGEVHDLLMSKGAPLRVGLF